MYNTHDILETIKMIEEEHLDIRTVTMGISLLDCIDSDIKLIDLVYEYATKNGINIILNCGDVIEGDYTSEEKCIKKTPPDLM